MLKKFKKHEDVSEKKITKFGNKEGNKFQRALRKKRIQSED